MSIKKKTSSVCPFCGKRYTGEVVLKNHLLRAHEKELHGLSPANVLFNIRNKKSGSNCIICKKPVTFNEITGKYNRLCENPKCKEAYIKLFKDRMKKVYGKEHLLDNANQQELMLSHRRISGELKFKDGKTFVYTGTYEKDFLDYMQNLEWKSNDLIMPAPFEVSYSFEGKKHFYIPDAYIPSLDLIIEIKGINKHYQARDYKKELTKDKAAEKSGHNFYKIVDKNYEDFLDGINEGRWNKPEKKKRSLQVLQESRKQQVIALSEQFLVDPKTVLINL